MRVPPAWLRRPVAVAVLAAAARGLLSTPWSAAVVGAGAVSTVVPGRWRPVRLTAFAVVGVLLEAAGVTC